MWSQAGVVFVFRLSLAIRSWTAYPQHATLNYPQITKTTTVHKKLPETQLLTNHPALCMEQDTVGYKNLLLVAPASPAKRTHLASLSSHRPKITNKPKVTQKDQFRKVTVVGYSFTKVKLISSVTTQPLNVAHGYAKKVPHFESSSGYLCKIVPVKVTGPKNSLNVYALLDDGSSDTLIDKHLAEYIGATGPDQTMSVNCAASMNKLWTVNLVDIYIRGLYDDEIFKLRNVKSVPDLGTKRQVVTIDDLVKFPYLRDIAKELSYNDATPLLIIGMDNWPLLTPRDIRHGSRNEPAAIRTHLGWAVFGQISASNPEDSQKCNKIYSHRVFHTQSPPRTWKNMLTSIGYHAKKFFNYFSSKFIKLEDMFF